MLGQLRTALAEHSLGMDTIRNLQIRLGSYTKSVPT
jgi:hypothetical protein